ncbi:trypsin-like serine protease [Raineyella sp. W15-4]|uniref:trypsin-like serine protease n=1 Tax=Raineyella sp. W15-4 TaxID=3081651 RepID=UPI0029548DA7|nr:trypsin-like serine protease [Raineyella sp. W15-4]WOQ16833.1 trypsin-like serine protease [Raineyella sp. W15-4]
MRTLVTALIASLLLVAGTSPAHAITHGTPDGDDHPYVGFLATYNATTGEGMLCSGTLLSERVFLTAGHCTAGNPTYVSVWFDAVPDPQHPDVVGGTAYTHPAYDPGTFYQHDVGVVVLDRPVPSATYGRLPAVNQLDSLGPGNRTTFTSVGYGLQASFPDAAAWKNRADVVRMVAHPRLVQINTGMPEVGDFAMLLSANANTGGICSGDSGGPNFLGDSTVIAGVTSYTRNPTCAGTAGVMRLDRSDVLDWVEGMLATAGH